MHKAIDFIGSIMDDPGSRRDRASRKRLLIAGNLEAEQMASHWIAVIVLLLIVAGGMALVWPLRKTKGRSFAADINGAGPAIHGEDHHHHPGGDGFWSHD